MKADVLFYGDRPISSVDEDDFGYKGMAEAIVKSIYEKSPKHGLVLGIEGDWGSGKSSFIKLVRDLLPDDDKIFHYEFNPWLIGNRDGLLHAFFDLLQSAIIDVHGKLTPNKNVLTPEARRALYELPKIIRKYESSIAVVSTALKASQSGGAKTTGWILATISKFFKQKQLVDRKRKASELLGQLPVHIIIFIDDIDRLIPSEAVEIVRLVKAVADFPNITYVFSYAQNELAASLERSLGISNGHSYLEKIIHVSFKVPAHEAFALRSWFKQKLLSSLQPQNKDNLSSSDDAVSRLMTVINVTGGRCLKTPRTVIRTLDAIALYYPAVREYVDLADLVWLQLIRIHSRELYNWIELYTHEAVSAIGNNQVSFNNTELELTELYKICSQLELDVDLIARELAQYLPGIESIADSKDNKRKWLGYKNLRSFEFDRADYNKRLSSPTYYRYYFSLSPTKESLANDAYNKVISDLAGAGNVDAVLNGIIDGDRGPARAEQFLALLGDRADKMTDENQIIAAINFLTTNMDIIGNATRKGDWGRIWPWVSARKVLQSLLNAIRPAKSDDFYIDVFKTGKAIGWLSDIMRQELFAHGRVDNPKKLETDWLLSDTAIDKVIEVMHQRYKEMDLRALADSPDPLDVLFAWLQSNGEAELKEWVKSNVISDTELIDFLWACRSWMASDRVYYPIKKSYVSRFCNYDEVVARIEKIDPNALSDPAAVRRLEDVKFNLKIGVQDD
jgi:predicted KAP-like P-loop ATPase